MKRSATIGGIALSIGPETSYAAKTFDVAKRERRPKSSKRRASFENNVNLIMAYAIAVGAVWALVYLVPQYPSIVRGSMGHGTPGTFVAEREDCGKSCNWYGTFTSDDGKTVRKVHSNHGTNHVGDTTLAIYSGDNTLVYPPGGSFDWLWAGIILAIAVGYLGLMAWVTSLFVRLKLR